ncbi:MAG: vWA domain-containing protein [Cyanobacteria bacterium J06600_6]
MYTEPLSSAKPGLIVIMVDQSGSMADPYGETNKANFAALAVNRVIGEIIQACSVGDGVKDRCFVAVIGYSSQAEVLFLEKVSELANNQNTMTLKKKISDGAGGIIEVPEILRVFVKPTAEGGTNMTKAFENAHIGASKFIDKNPDSFPPIIINITDGEPNSFINASIAAKKLLQLQSSDGNVILLNAHIASTLAGKIELPSNNEGFRENKFAQFLFENSSILPDMLAQRAKEVGFNAQPNARGFAFNADAETLVNILNFGSLGALR